MKIEQLEDGTVRLTVTDLRPEDAGRYRMKASNGNGDAITESAVTVDREWRVEMKGDGVPRVVCFSLQRVIWTTGMCGCMELCHCGRAIRSLTTTFT